MASVMASATDWLRAARARWMLWGGVACYLLAAPFLLLITWSAVQVWQAGPAHALDARRVGAIAAVSLARHHAIPFTAFAVVSLAVAYTGGALMHRAVRRGA